MDASTSHHLGLLSIFHYVLAGLGALFSLVPAMYVVMGVAMVSGVFNGNSQDAAVGVNPEQDPFRPARASRTSEEPRWDAAGSVPVDNCRP